MPYDSILTRIVRYIKKYYTLKELNITSSNLENYSSFKLLSTYLTKSYIIPLIFTNILLYIARFVTNLNVKLKKVYIYTRADIVEILYENLDFRNNFTIYYYLFDDI